MPLDGTHTVLDWAVALKLPLIVVTGSYLGTLSHTLTALTVIAAAKLEVAALVVDESANSAVPLDDTVATLGRFAPAIPIVPLPRGAQAEDFARLAALLK